MRRHLLSAVVLATATNTAESYSSTIQIMAKTDGKAHWSTHDRLEHMRIVTKPRAEYNEIRDTPKFYDAEDGSCKGIAANYSPENFAQIPDQDKWSGFQDFLLWNDLQGVSLDEDTEIQVDELFIEGENCVSNFDAGPDATQILPNDVEYNVYLASAYVRSDIHYNRVVEFSNQDIIALIYTKDTLYNSDATLGREDRHYKHDAARGSSSSGEESEKGTLDVGTYVASEDLSFRSGYAVNCAVAGTNCPIATILVEPKKTNSSEPDIAYEVPEDLGNANCPTCKATGWGESHIVTFDGLSYDVHAKGELTFVKSLLTDFTIQARTKAVGNDSKGPAVTTGVVVHEDSQFDFPIVQVSMGQSADSELATMFGICPVQLFVDNNATSIKDGTGSDFATVQVKDDRIVIEYPNSFLRLDMQVRVWKDECHFIVNYHLVDCRCDDTLVGLLGQPDFPKDWTNDWHKLSGIPVPIPRRRSDRRRKKAYDYSRTWCASAEESHFTYETGMSHDDFDQCSDEKGGADNFDIDIQDLIQNANEMTSFQCILDGELDEGCIMDCHFGGEDACNEFVTIANTLHGMVAVIEEPEINLKVPETSANPSCPVCKAVGWGDPHIITFDGLSYDVHVKGELTFLKSLDPNSNFEIQARTQSVANHPKGPAVTTGVVIHESGQPTIQVSIGKSTNSLEATMFGQCPVQLYVDEFPKDIEAGTGLSRATVQVNGNRIVVEYPNIKLRLDMNLHVWRNTCHFSVTYFLADCRCDERLVGILGQPDGSWENDWHMNDGTPVSIPASRLKRRGREAYDYSLNWCVDEANSHFTYEPSTSHSDFDFCTGTKGAENYDIDLESIMNEADTYIVNKCTINGRLDEGCLIECHFLGEDACDEYVTIVGETQAFIFTESPTSAPPTNSPTGGPTGGPTPTIAPTKSRSVSFGSFGG